jgi:hydroxypyruvate reductase
LIDVRSQIIQIYQAAVQACMPETAVYRYLGEFTESLKSAGRIVLVSIGKAAVSMVKGAVRFFEEQNIAIEKTFVVVPHGAEGLTESPSLSIFYAGHPLPDGNSLEAARTVLSYITKLKSADIVLLLISGGGSSLFELPQPGMSLADLQSWYARLLASGRPIHEVNAERQSRSLVKGGRLARSTEAGVIQLLLSDVPGNDPAVIASGPGYAPELKHNTTRIIGSADIALRAATEEAKRLGYRVLPLSASLQGDAAQVGESMAALCLEMEALGIDAPIALLAAGETTVSVTGKGRGGRNMHLALASAIRIAGRSSSITIGSLGTDGRDGPTDAAGAIVDADTVAKIEKHGWDARSALADCNSYPVLDAADALYRCGYTGTNVNDIMAAIIRPDR